MLIIHLRTFVSAILYIHLESILLASLQNFHHLTTSVSLVTAHLTAMVQKAPTDGPQSMEMS